MSDQAFNYSLFNEYDKEIIKQLIDAGEMDKIPNAIIIQNQEQEREVAILLSAKAKPVVFEESKVRQEMIELQSKDNLPIITTPEEEAKWQQKIDEEKAIQNKKYEEQKKREIEALEIASKSKKTKPASPVEKVIEKEKVIDQKLVLTQ